MIHVTGCRNCYLIRTKIAARWYNQNFWKFMRISEKWRKAKNIMFWTFGTFLNISENQNLLIFHFRLGFGKVSRFSFRENARISMKISKFYIIFMKFRKAKIAAMSRDLATAILYEIIHVTDGRNCYLIRTQNLLSYTMGGVGTGCSEIKIIFSNLERFW